MRSANVPSNTWPKPAFTLQTVVADALRRLTQLRERKFSWPQTLIDRFCHTLYRRQVNGHRLIVTMTYRLNPPPEQEVKNAENGNATVCSEHCH